MITQNESKFIAEFFDLVSRYNVSFSATDTPVFVCVDDRHIMSIVEGDNGAEIRIGVEID